MHGIRNFLNGHFHEILGFASTLMRHERFRLHRFSISFLYWTSDILHNLPVLFTNLSQSWYDVFYYHVVNVVFSQRRNPHLFS